LWWLALESIISDSDRIEIDGRVIASATTREKYRAHAMLQNMLLNQPSDSEERAFMGRLAARYGYDQMAANRAACMNWDNIIELAANPLATIGAHTVSHPMLTKAPEHVVREEFAQSRRILEHKLQREICHLAYPYGSADAVGTREFAIASDIGYQTGVTTLTDVLSADDGSRLMSLPRIAINGRFQRERHLEVLLSGLGPKAWRGLRRTMGGFALR
jgi:hypothetical protein